MRTASTIVRLGSVGPSYRSNCLLSNNICNRAASAANTSGSTVNSCRLASIACWGAIWRSPDRSTRAIVTASAIPRAGSPALGACHRPHFTATQCLPWARSWAAITSSSRLAAEYATTPCPPHTPITEEHSRVRTSGRSGHSSIIWARPSTLAAKLSTTAADVTPGAVPEITLPAACTINEAPTPPYSAAIADNWVGSVISHGGDTITVPCCFLSMATVA
ncbi:Uncharacterised protein [Mycobacterium tuberculosis]|nr:Uncharacterised protein [Mycobacterium tuberculosis]